MNINDGAGVPAIAESTGMSESEVEELIKAEESLYPNITKFQKYVTKQIEGSRKPVNAFGSVVGMGKWQCPTGTIYSFYEGSETKRFSHPQVCNYPIQGAGGEVVQVILGKLFRLFRERNNYDRKAYLVNTVHDCVWVDIHSEVVDQVCADVKRVMESVPETFNELHGWKPNDRYYIDVPFRVDVEIGKNMLELNHWSAK